MRIVALPRGRGKTTEVLKWMTEADSNTVRVYVGHTNAAAMQALRMSREEELGLESWQFIGIDELLSGYRPFPMFAGLVRNFEFGFDNIDLTLITLCRNRVGIITATEEE